MPPKKTEQEKARARFVAGQADFWNAGRYGVTVKAVAEGGSLLLKWSNPRRRQRTVFSEDTKENRRKLTEVACELRNELENPTRSKAPVTTTEAPLPVTFGAVWDYYLKDKFPGITPGVIDGGRTAARAYFESLTPELKEKAPGIAYLFTTLQAMRRTQAFEGYRADRLVAEVEPIEWEKYTVWRRTRGGPGSYNGEPYSLQTLSTDFTRLHSAIKHCKTKRRRWWGGTPDPLEGADVDRSDAEVPEIGEQEARALIRRLKLGLPRSWRTLGSVLIQHGSGRRVGAVGADSTGVDADGLRATDFFLMDGRLHVRWRAEAAKGQGYGRGDEITPATRSLAVAYRWLRWFHPNPIGPEHPLIWSPKDLADLLESTGSATEPFPAQPSPRSCR